MSLIKRHLSAAWYVLAVILPVLLKTGKRPVIFSRYAGMGDIIGTFPAALALKQRHPRATFIYNCAASSACLPAMGGITDKITHFKEIGLVEHWYGLLLGGFYHFSYGDEFGHSASTEITIREFGRPFGLELSDAHPKLAIDHRAVEQMQARLAQMGCPLANLIVIHPGPSWPVRTWPRASWIRLLAELRQHGFANVIQIGAGIQAYANVGAEDFPPLPEIQSLVDRLTLVETIALISLARLFVGIDSGLLHFAACLRIPTVGIFGPTAPELRFAHGFTRRFVITGVGCRGCHHRLPRLHWEKGCPYNIQCMKEISPENVLHACLAYLAPVGNTP